MSLCFASQRIPTVCPHCAGSISTIGLRSFLLKVSGVSSHLSFCCTCLVSGFIISEKMPLVHSQSAQKFGQSFSILVRKIVNIDIFSSMRGSTPGAAICLWRCAGSCSTAARCPGSFSVCCSVVVPRQRMRPHLIYKFYISDISVLYTIWNFIQTRPFVLIAPRAFD